MISVEYGNFHPPKFAVFHMFNRSDSARVPADIIRSVCENLELPPDIFDVKH